MTNNTSSSYGAAQGIMAKTALNELRASGHPLGRPLALCLMFEAAENQLVAASVFNLAIALDAALHIPTESLLAEIRIQWWADALASKTNQNVPLIARLQSQYQRHDNFFTQLQGIIGKWQAACHHKTRDSSEGWVAVWRSIAFHLGHMTALDQAALIGRELHNATLGQKCYGFAGSLTPSRQDFPIHRQKFMPIQPLTLFKLWGWRGGVFIPPKNMGENFDKSLKMY